MSDSSVVTVLPFGDEGSRLPLRESRRASHRPALCCGSRQNTNLDLVRLNVSIRPSCRRDDIKRSSRKGSVNSRFRNTVTLTTVNLTCRATDLRLMAAVPALSVRRMLEARRRVPLDSPPSPAAEQTIEPPSVDEMPAPRHDTNSLLISSLALSCSKAAAARVVGLSRDALSQPLAEYSTGLVPCRCCSTN